MFKFKQRPVELFDRKIELKILNTERALREATIGAFMVCLNHALSCILCLVLPVHLLTNRWMLALCTMSQVCTAEWYPVSCVLIVDVMIIMLC